ncbi:endo-1,4-beta-xylanase [Streptomonospora litoralis]|uniref:endo-1,4-beta-xylanase n=1 Tax=Streptomonospora litoralis TaxID=2498135 RepID=A0A4P6Q6E5_9ACTN|nr:endo-1,4-beta-xylanase [Streptomonospora litoralis]QBI54484.1 Endo-1,4-beta-xylanase Z precursor [Streptomonospora litoralis]
MVDPRPRRSRLRAAAIAGSAVLVFALAVVAVRAAAGHTQAGGVPLRDLAAERGIRIGAAVDPVLLEDHRAYRALVAEQYGSMTAENVMKWDTLQPEFGSFDFSAAETLLEFADRNGQRMRGHTLLWHNQNPRWLAEGEFSAAELREVMHDHIDTVVGDRFKGPRTSAGSPTWGWR